MASIPVWADVGCRRYAVRRIWWHLAPVCKTFLKGKFRLLWLLPNPQDEDMALNFHIIKDCDTLITGLRGIDLTVPGRTQGRTTDHAETWIACRLLSTLAQTDRLRFPVTVIHRDRPDILIQSGNVNIGVEITEAIAPDYAAYCALADREFPSKLLEPGHFRWGTPPLSVEEKRDLLRQSKMTSDGWVGNRPEQEWALFIQSLVEKKLKKLTNNGFEKFDVNWLSVYDNLPLPNVQLEHAIALLQPLLESMWHRIPCFDALFIERGHVIAEITPQGSTHLLLRDIWK